MVIGIFFVTFFHAYVLEMLQSSCPVIVSAHLLSLPEKQTNTESSKLQTGMFGVAFSITFIWKWISNKASDWLAFRELSGNSSLGK